MQRGSNPSSGAVDLANSRELVKILLLVLAKIFLFCEIERISQQNFAFCQKIKESVRS
jgi:hypothetical protein